jgi:hypothetical protein
MGLKVRKGKENMKEKKIKKRKKIKNKKKYIIIFKSIKIYNFKEKNKEKEN